METADSFKSRLAQLVYELKAPKNKNNDFGHYKYRSAEGILEAVKPLLKQYNMILNLSDAVVQVGERYYVKATATLSDIMSNSSIESSAMARESAERKGQDESQITGTASSYARKYALNGLFLLDDTKDADTNEFQEESNARAKDADTKNDLATIPQKNALKSIAEKHKINLDAIYKANNCTEDTLTSGQATFLLTEFNKKYGEK